MPIHQINTYMIKAAICPTMQYTHLSCTTSSDSLPRGEMRPENRTELCIYGVLSFFMSLFKNLLINRNTLLLVDGKQCRNITQSTKKQVYKLLSCSDLLISECMTDDSPQGKILAVRVRPFKSFIYVFIYLFSRVRHGVLRMSLSTGTAVSQFPSFFFIKS